MDSDEEMEYSPSWKGVPACVVLINVYDPLQHQTAETALAATCRLIRQNLRLANSNHVGVCLYGLDNSGKESFHDVFPLNNPTLEDFKKLRELNISSFKQAKEFKMSDVLPHCSKMFSNCKKLLSSSTVLLLTRLDTPPIQSDQLPTIQTVHDLVDNNIEVKFLNISKLDYEIDEFYENFLSEANKGRGAVIPRTVWDPKEIELLMHQQTDRHLTVAKLSIEIGNGLSIGVGIYNLIKTSQGLYQKRSNLTREDNAIVNSVSKAMKETCRLDTGEEMDVDDNGTTRVPLLKSEILHYQEYGNERVEFTDNEMKSLKNPFGPPMMKLLGFKPFHILCKEKWFLKPCSFLFPNESIIEGSTVAFKALHQACTETSMVAICVLCTRVNSRPKIVALSPCTSPLGQDVEMGFDVIQLPFIENVREVPVVEEEETTISTADKSVMRDILETLKFDYNCNLFENPKIQSTYRAIEAIALNEDDIEPFVDTTKRDPKVFEDLKDELFEEIFGPFGSTASKRVGTGTSSGNQSKKARTEENGLDADAILKQRVSNRELNRYTVKELRDIVKLTKNTEPLTGKNKAELIELVYQNYEK